MRRFSVAAVVMTLVLGCSAAQQSATPFAGTEDGQRPEQPKQSPAGGEQAHRKIIYNASIELRVDNLSEAADKLDMLVQAHHGLIAGSDVNTNPHIPRSGNWQVRIPVDGFSDFLKQVAKLGEGLRDKVNSEDITEKYFDSQIRIDNKKVQVERLQKILKEQTGKISDVLEAERELGRVTTELEQLKGSVKLWDNQVALATVDIVMSERRQYVSPESPTFASSISHTFHGSLDNFLAFLQMAALVAVALVPWTPLIALGVGGLWLLFRRPAQRPRLEAPSGKTVA
jgi:hypothetical protein